MLRAGFVQNESLKSDVAGTASRESIQEFHVCKAKEIRGGI
jgi:hypothetical protein